MMVMRLFYRPPTQLAKFSATLYSETKLTLLPQVRVNLGEAHDEDGNVTDSRWIDMIVSGEDVYFVRTSSYRPLSRTDQPDLALPPYCFGWI
jgi:hypothetical protein